MAVRSAEGREVALEAVWEAHREGIRRLLLSLSRDLDLADDLVQETYLCARAGFPSYRGGDARAWLAAIARNVYRTHRRRRYVSAEVALGSCDEAEEAPGYDRHDLLVVLQALSEFPSVVRTALLMKHYAGFTYEEIARRQQCPEGTVRSRISQALGQLRAALRPERRAEMTESATAHGVPIVDYVYGVLPADAAAKVKAHLAECESCRREGEELGKVAAALDALEGDTRQMHFLELDRAGGYALYVFGSHINATDHAMDTWVFQSGRGDKISHYYQGGEEAAFSVAPAPQREDLNEYTVSLPRSVPPGGWLRELVVFAHESTPSSQGVQILGRGRYRFGWQQTPGAEGGTTYVQVVRLPAGAELLSSDPQPAEVRGGVRTTLVWRTVLAVDEGFHCTVEYRLEEGEQRAAPRPGVTFRVGSRVYYL